MAEQPAIDWKSVVELIQRGDPSGEQILYDALMSGARFFLQRRLGAQDVEDQVHELFLTLIETIRRGEIEYPERLMGFVRTLLLRQLSRGIKSAIHKRETETGIVNIADHRDAASTPEEQAVATQKLELMKIVLRELNDRDYEILSRFYLREHPKQRICREMNLSSEQFDLVKSRAKARLAELVRRKLGAGGSASRG